MPINPTSVISSLVSAASSSITLLTFLKDLKNTPLDVKNCIALTTLISSDLKYLIKLRSSPSNASYLSQNLDLARRIDSIIVSAQQAIFDVCRLLEGCREEVYEGGNVPLKEKMKWVLGDSGAFKRREGNLQGVHRAVLSEVTFLRMREQTGETVSRVFECVSFENLELLEMVHRRREKNSPKGKGVEITCEEVGNEDGDGEERNEKVRIEEVNKWKGQEEVRNEKMRVIGARKGREEPVANAEAPKDSPRLPEPAEPETSLARHGSLLESFGIEVAFPQSARPGPSRSVSVDEGRPRPQNEDGIELVSPLGTWSRTSASLNERRLMPHNEDGIEVASPQGTWTRSSESRVVNDRRLTPHNESLYEDEDDGLEAAFYRDLKQQEDERQRRLQARRNQLP